MCLGTWGGDVTMVAGYSCQLLTVCSPLGEHAAL